MGGCTNCGAKAGCDHRKTGMFAALEEALVRLYPERKWGTPARAGVVAPGADAERLSESLAESLKASTFFRAGDAGEYCDYIYVLCMGREPCLVQLRDADIALPEELENGTVEELYLRVCISQLAPFAGVQQVAMRGELEDSELYVVESPRAGVYDAPLLPRFQSLVAELVALDLEHIDFGEISAPPPGYDASDYKTRYGIAEPTVANYLFYPQPATTEVSEVVVLSRAL